MNSPVSSVTSDEAFEGDSQATTAIVDALAVALLTQAPQLKPIFLSFLQSHASGRATMLKSPGARAAFEQRVKFMTDMARQP